MYTLGDYERRVEIAFARGQSFIQSQLYIMAKYVDRTIPKPNGE